MVFRDPSSTDRSSEAVGSQLSAFHPTLGTSGGITPLSSSRQDNNCFKFGPTDPRSLIQSHAAVRSSAILPSFPSGRPVIASWFILTNVREPIYSDLFPLLTQHCGFSKDSGLKIIDLTDWAMAELQS